MTLALALALSPLLLASAPASPPPPTEVEVEVAVTSPAPMADGTDSPAADAPADAPAAKSPYAALAGVEYVEILTAGADARAPLPMIVAIHGLGDRPERFAAALRAYPAPARVILPRAFDASGDGFSWFPVRARSKDIAGLASGIESAAGRLAPFLAALPGARPTVGKPIVTGFSQGGMLSFALAVHHPHELAAAFPVGGWLPPPLWPANRPVDRPLPPITAFHGDADAVVRVEPTREAVARLIELGYPATLREYPGVAHELPAALRRDLYEAIAAAAKAQEPRP